MYTNYSLYMFIKFRDKPYKHDLALSMHAVQAEALKHELYKTD